jgi:3-oxoadipate enol-lactonase
MGIVKMAGMIFKQLDFMRSSGDNIKIQINDILVNYNDNGPLLAPAIIFVHGFPFNKNIFDLQAEMFKSNYRVVTYDVRGHGQTSRGDRKPDIELLGSDLISLMDALDIDRAIVCGLSMGGYIALDAVLRFPKRFNGLVLSGTRCASDDERAKEQRFASIDVIIEKGKDVYADESLKKLFAPVSFTGRREEVKATRNMIIETPVDVINNTLIALAERKETCSRLREIDIPSLILVGKEDKVTPLSEAKYLQSQINGSFLEVIEYAGHLANLENTHDYNAALKNFIIEVCEKLALSPHCES